ncbi:NADPH:quinone reductase-like Zn-dependent oxidoreductase [Sinobacterium caligoides]|uniref:NADPH:quinone reductase-like Zn-dependent oxidoreductase n=1 Tax=Sinobacterium caligoides TaxID=933926 RepID=A0A3N2DK02_9GAMM|nr:medium chain dehydrogenase/reductase family protein [Sinobacterium caligoides]ROS00130.1 NADPH:quinone reductase-like Zn-dependent oxidoreductase [Sinobacterium caligoides]
MPYEKVVVTAFGGPEVLQLKRELQLPEPTEHELRIKVLAAGTGFTDTIIREGQYVDNKAKPPFVIGYDWFGVVDKVGSKVTQFQVGDHVADLCMIGGYTQYLTVEASRVIAAPDDLDPAEAVAMILSYGTAYQMLKRVSPLPSGSTALVHAAGGAVGSALCELGRLMGIKVIGTASKAKHPLLAKFGAKPIDYRSEDFVERVQQLTDKQGVEIVFDTIGGKSWGRSYQCLKRGGTLIGFGAYQLTTGEEKLPSLLWGFFKLLAGWKLLPDGKKSCFFNIQKRRESHQEEFKEDIGELFEWLRQGKLQPVIAERRPLAEAAEVHRQIDNAEIIGKTVLICQP